MITLLIVRPGKIKTTMTAYVSQEDSPWDIKEVLAAMEGADMPFSLLANIITEVHQRPHGTLKQGDFHVAWECKIEPQAEVIRNLLEQL